ncbi:MAG: D-amino-acid transaminase [Hyphomicrobium sp.]
MSRVIYVNGRYRPAAEASVHAEDRGFQFADSVYEVIEVLDRRLVDASRHFNRLDRSLRELGMAPPMTRAALNCVIGEIVRRNRVRDGVVYLQVTRGAGPRDFAFPGPEAAPTLVVLARSQSREKFSAAAEAGIAVKSMPEIRWGRSDIKTVMLLPACLAKDAARREGAREAWFVDADGFVTEGASSNAWIVSAERTLVTRHLDARILGGVTRATAIDAARALGLNFEERAFSLNDAYAAREAFITSATNTVMPVVMIDGRPIGDGKPGPLAQRLRSHFHQNAEISSPI